MIRQKSSRSNIKEYTKKTEQILEIKTIVLKYTREQIKLQDLVYSDRCHCGKYSEYDIIYR